MSGALPKVTARVFTVRRRTRPPSPHTTLPSRPQPPRPRRRRSVPPQLAQQPPRLLRPLNYPVGTIGQGSIVLETAKGKVGVINVQGRTFMQPPLENPFLAMQEAVERMRQETPVIFVDIHAETTSEKIAMGRFLDGKVSAVVGTHTHTQTADEQIFPGGTAFLCDAGMCGPVESVLGRDIQSIIQRFLTGLPVTYPVARGPVVLHGAMVDIDLETGKALHIERVVHRVESASQP